MGRLGRPRFRVAEELPRCDSTRISDLSPQAAQHGRLSRRWRLILRPACNAESEAAWCWPAIVARTVTRRRMLAPENGGLPAVRRPGRQRPAPGASGSPAAVIGGVGSPARRARHRLLRLVGDTRASVEVRALTGQAVQQRHDLGPSAMAVTLRVVMSLKLNASLQAGFQAGTGRSRRRGVAVIVGGWDRAGQ